MKTSGTKTSKEVVGGKLDKALVEKVRGLTVSQKVNLRQLLLLKQVESKKPKNETESASENKGERDLLDVVIKVLRERGVEIQSGDSSAMVMGCLWGAELAVQGNRRREQEKQSIQQERTHRDGLHGQEKLDYIAERFRKCFSGYNAPYQDKEILPLALKEQQVPEDWKSTHNGLVYIKGKLEGVLGGCSESFRQKVVAKYRANVLPALVAEHKEEQAEQDAVDEFLALTNGKATEQVWAMVRVLGLYSQEQASMEKKSGVHLKIEEKSFQPEITIFEAEKELAKCLYFTADANLHILNIAIDLLLEINTKAINEDDINIGAGVGKYVKAKGLNDTWEDTLTHGTKNLLGLLCQWPKFIQDKVLASAVEKTTVIVEKRGKVQGKEAVSRFASICDSLDAKTKFIILVGEELNCLEGVNIKGFADVWQKLTQKESADKIIAEIKDSDFWQDDNVQFLYNQYVLADAINAAS